MALAPVILDDNNEETTVPETTVPEATVPEATVPEATVPEATDSGKSPIQKRKERRLGFAKTILESLEDKDIAQQRGQVPTLSRDDAFRQLLNATTQEEIDATGFSTINGKAMHPFLLDTIKRDATGEKEAELYFDFIKEFKELETISEGELAVPFSTREGDVRLPLEAMAYSPRTQQRMEQIVENTVQVGKVLKNSKLPLRGQEVLLDNFESGNFIVETGRMLRDLPADVAQTLPTLALTGVNAVAGVTGATLESIGLMDRPGTEFDTFGQRVGRIYSNNQGKTIDFLRNSLYKGADATVIFRSGIKRFNQFYKKKFIESYSTQEAGEKAWSETHQKPVMRQTFNDVGNPTGVEYELDDKGNPVMKDDFSLVEPIAAELLDQSFQQLSSPQKTLVYLSNILPLSQLSVALNIKKGTSMFDTVSEAKRINPTKYANVDDYTIFKQVSKENSFGQFDAARRATKIFSLGTMGGSAGTLARGKVVKEHLSNIEQYENTIDTLEQDITKIQESLTGLTRKDPKYSTLRGQLKDQENLLSFQKESFLIYKSKAGRGMFNSPFSKKVLIDDTIISAALGYSDMLEPLTSAIGLPEGSSSFLVALAGPFVAPPAARAVTNVAVGLAKRVPPFSYGVESVKSVANVLENSDLFSIITPGMLIGGDITAIKKAGEAAGVPVSEETILAVKDFARIIRSADTAAIFTAGGKPINMQQRMYNSLVNYNVMMKATKESMRNTRGRDGSVVFSEEEIATNMSALHLSIAHASGLAPLIALQAQNVKLSSRDLTSSSGGKKLQDAFMALAEEEKVINGMDIQVNILKQKFEAEGVDLNTNDSLQQTISMLEGVSLSNKDQISYKKQEFNKLLDIYIESVEDVTPDMLDELVKLKTIALNIEPSDAVAQARIIDETAGLLLGRIANTNANLQTFSRNLSEREVIEAIQTNADQFFNIVSARTESKKVVGYNKVDTYANENNIKIDVGGVFTKLVGLVDDLKNNPIETFFLKKDAYFRNEGRTIKSTFDVMAERGLKKTMSENDLKALMDINVELGNIENTADFSGMAFLMNKDSSTPFEFFDATIKETETIRRHFSLKQHRNNQQNPVQKAQAVIDQEFMSVVDDAVATADSSGELSRRMFAARKVYQQTEGETFAPGTYGGIVKANTVRETIVFPEEKALSEGLDEADVSKGVAITKRDANSAVYPFKSIRANIRKALEAKTAEEKDIAMLQIQQDMGVLLQFSGRQQKPNNNQAVYAIELSDEADQQVATSLQEILGTILKHESEVFLYKSIGKSRTPTPDLPENLTAGEKSRIKQMQDAEEKMRKLGGELDFEKANTLLELESTLSIPVVENVGDAVTYRRHNLTDYGDEFRNVDKLLADKKEWADSYNAIQKNINNTESPLRIAANKALEEETDVLDKVTALEIDAGRPDVFFDKFFEVATPETIATLKKRFKAGGMNDDEVDIALRTLYMKGILSKSDTRITKQAGLIDAKQTVADIDTLIQYTESPGNYAVMEAILGEEHAKSVKLFADWAVTAKGDGMNFRKIPETMGMSVESIISRAFNYARGLVSLEYITAEVGVRLLVANGSSAVEMILRDKSAAGALGYLLQTPTIKSPKEINTLGQRIQFHLLFGGEGILRNEGEIPALETFLGSGTIQEQTVSSREREQDALARAVRAGLE